MFPLFQVLLNSIWLCTWGCKDIRKVSRGLLVCSSLLLSHITSHSVCEALILLVFQCILQLMWINWSNMLIWQRSTWRLTISFFLIIKKLNQEYTGQSQNTIAFTLRCWNALHCQWLHGECSCKATCWVQVFAHSRRLPPSPPLCAALF